MVLESYAVQAWGLLWCFYSDGLSEQLLPPVQAFQFDNLSFLHDRSSLHIERAYFTQLSPCCDNSDDVFGIMVFDELVKKFELNVRACGWIILLIIEVECVVAWYAFLVLQEPSWSIRQVDVVPFTVSMTVIVSTTNVGWRRSCWDSACTTPDWWWFLSPTRHSLVNCCLFLSTRSTRSFFDGSCLTHFMTTATLIMYN